MSSGNDSNEFPPGEGGAPAEGADAPLNTGRPAVASAPGKMVFVLLFAGIFVFIIIRSLMFSKEEAPPPPEKHKEHVTAADSKGGEISISPGSLPAPPTELASPTTPPPPPLPPPPPQILTPPAIVTNGAAPTNEALAKRIHSPMFVVGGSNSAAKVAGIRRKSAVSATNDPNGAFADSIADSKGQESVATKVENLRSTIIQGKLIHAVLESAIDSDLPGTIRAIVSHDVYAEAGRDILIPKGSRIIGTYNSNVKHGQARVFIVWQRVVRPDGVDIEVESPGVDALGRAGMGGDVDNKYFEMFSSAILTSSVEIGVAAVGDALFGNQQQTTTQGGGGVTTTSSPTATAMQTAVQNIGQVGQSIVQNAINESPTINIDQGTPINVFVNRDLIFPREVVGGAGFID